MKKFHINPETGYVGRCSATIKDCKYGFSDTEHYDTEQEAQKAYEDTMKNEILIKKTKKTDVKNTEVRLSNVLDIDLLNKMVDTGFISHREHPDDPALKVLCYTPMTMQKGRWNDATKLARGLIIRSEKDDYSDAVIIQRPWKKFYTLQQVETGWALGDEEDGAADSAHSELSLLDFHAEAEVTDKLDGSLGILYRDPSGKLAFSTKGSFTSEQAVFFTKMMRKNSKYYDAAEKLMNDNPNTTFTFEIIGDAGGVNEHIINYENDDIVLIGAIDKDSGKYHSVNDYKDIWNESNGLSVAETMPAKNLTEAFELPPRANREGVVVRIFSDDPDKQMQIKIKQDDYMALHKMANGFTKKEARSILKNSKISYSDFIKIAEDEDITRIKSIKDSVSFEEGASDREIFLKNKFKNSFNTVVIPQAKKVSETKKFIDALPESFFTLEENEAKKNFAHFIKDQPSSNKGTLFRFFNMRLNNVDFDSVDADAEINSIIKNL